MNQVLDPPTMATRVQSLIRLDEAVFREKFNKSAFVFRHGLAEHPLFQLDSLIALANRLPPEQVLHRRGRVPIGSNFDRLLFDRDHPLPVEAVLEDLAHADGYVFLHYADTDPEYGAFLRQLMAELRPMVESIDPGMYEERFYIFIVSPGAVTPYHQDRVTNFLCQVRGTKTMQLWDPADRSVVSEEDLERLFGRTDLPKPGFRPEFAAKAQSFALRPGLGVHHPFAAPHAAVCGDEISIALGVTWLSKSMHRRTTIYRANYALRRYGLKPRPPGEVPWIDEIKYRAFRVAERARNMVRRKNRR